MRWKEYFVFPAIAVMVIVGWIAWEATRAKSVQEDQFRLPSSNDPLVLLEFIRQLHVDASQEGWQLQRTCSSMREVTKRLRKQLSKDELLPAFAELCDLHYRLLSATRLESITNAQRQQLVSEFIKFMSRADAFPDHKHDAFLLSNTLTLMLAMLETQGAEQQAMLDFAQSMQSAFQSSDDRILAELTEKSLEGFVHRIGLLGKPFDLKSNTIDGHPIDIGDSLGKVVLVEFWSTRCGPCVSELPMLQAIYEKHSDFEIIGVSRDRSKRRLKSFLDSRRVTWPQLWHDPEIGNLELTESLGVYRLPSSILIDREGIVVAFNVRASSLESWIKQLPESH